MALILIAVIDYDYDIDKYGLMYSRIAFYDASKNKYIVGRIIVGESVCGIRGIWRVEKTCQ